MINENSGFILRRYDSINIGLAVLFAWIPLTALASAALGESYQQTSIFLGLQLIYLGSIFNALPAIFRGSIKNSLILFIIGFAAVYLISSLVCQDQLLKEQAFRTFYLWCLPYFILSIRVKDFGLLFQTLKTVGLIAIVCEVLKVLVFTSITNYSQDVGYDALLPFVVFYLSFLKEQNYKYIILSLISFALILMSGSRGPLFCAILSFVSIFIYRNRFTRKTVTYAIILIALYALYIIFEEQILSWLMGLFTDLSVSTRSIEMLINNEIASDDIRDSLRNESFAYAFTHPLVGSGFLNDRVYLYKFGFITSNTAAVFGSYSHFFIAEILMQLGLIPGAIGLFIFFKNILNKIRYSFDQYEAYVFIIVLTIGLFPLLVSRSWFSYPYFYLILGLLFSRSTNQFSDTGRND